ncbi:MAG: MBL fold metallo-hydrolase [Jiangellaceae bacterium]|nr:MBL fold metallo-hydrolase [Jiangellaceae bacterium]
MFVTTVPAPIFGTNCYVMAPAVGEECVVVDPGIGVLSALDSTLREARLRPVAVLLTHGHVDHVYSVTPVCGARGVAAYIHGDDRYRLADPIGTLDPLVVEMLRAQFGRIRWAEPDDVRPLTDGMMLSVAGLSIRVDHAPGHTEGSVLFHLPAPAADDAPTCLSGDVLFAGSIGRTDLAGGDHATMLHTLGTKILPLPDDTAVLPGHGPATTIGRERASNPFLQGLPVGPGPVSAPPGR